MTLHEIQNVLPVSIHLSATLDKIMVNGRYMGNLYRDDDTVYATLECVLDNPNEYIRRDMFLSLFNYELLVHLQRTFTEVQIYRLLGFK